MRIERLKTRKGDEKKSTRAAINLNVVLSLYEELWTGSLEWGFK